MFGRIVWFGTGAVSGAIGTLWAERKVRRAIRAQRRAAAQRMVAPPDSAREAMVRRGMSAQRKARDFYARYRVQR